MAAPPPSYGSLSAQPPPAMPLLQSVQNLVLQGDADEEIDVMQDPNFDDLSLYYTIAMTLDQVEFAKNSGAIDEQKYRDMAEEMLASLLSQEKVLRSFPEFDHTRVYDSSQFLKAFMRQYQVEPNMFSRVQQRVEKGISQTGSRRHLGANLFELADVLVTARDSILAPCEGELTWDFVVTQLTDVTLALRKVETQLPGLLKTYERDLETWRRLGLEQPHRPITVEEKNDVSGLIIRLYESTKMHLNAPS